MDTIKLDFITAQLRSEHPQWTNSRVFETAVAQAGHQGTFGRDSVDWNAVLAEAKDSGPAKLGRHPAVAKEFAKLGQLHESRKDQGALNYADRLKAIHKLMTERNLSFDEAFIQTMQGEPLSDATKAPAKAAQSVSHGNGKLMLIQGAHMGWAFNIHTGERAGVNGQP
jgi:hypothetical protein